MVIKQKHSTECFPIKPIQTCRAKVDHLRREQLFSITCESVNPNIDNSSLDTSIFLVTKRQVVSRSKHTLVKKGWKRIRSSEKQKTRKPMEVMQNPQTLQSEVPNPQKSLQSVVYHDSQPILILHLRNSNVQIVFVSMQHQFIVSKVVMEREKNFTSCKMFIPQ